MRPSQTADPAQKSPRPATASSRHPAFGAPIHRLSAPSRHAIPFTLTLLAAIGAQAQATGWRSFVSVTPVHQGEAGLDGGGDYDAQGLILRAGAQREILAAGAASA